jgi:hypothetical protein
MATQPHPKPFLNMLVLLEIYKDGRLYAYQSHNNFKFSDPFLVVFVLEKVPSY